MNALKSSGTIDWSSLEMQDQIHAKSQTKRKWKKAGAGSMPGAKE